MYCQSCGTEVAAELSFCKRCGANLVAAPLVVQTEAPLAKITKPTLIISATIIILTLGGFGAVISGAMALATSAGIRQDPVMAVVMLGMCTILIADVILGIQLSRLIRYSLKTPEVVFQPRSLAPENPALKIPTQMRPVPSVTENTTRTLSTAFNHGKESEAAKTLSE